MTQHMPQSGPLRFGPLGPRTAHLCIDMQNLFADDTPWHTPWMKRVLPVVVEIAERHPERTIFTRFIPAHHPDELPGSWRRYYRHWAELTLERIDKRLLELVPPLARLAPPAAVIDKRLYSPFSVPALHRLLRERGVDSLVVTGAETDVCVLAAGLDAGDLRHSGVFGARAAVCLSVQSAAPPSEPQRRPRRLGRVLRLHLRQHRLGARIVGLAVQGESEIARDVVVAGIDQRLVRQLRELPRKGVVEPVRVTAIVAIAGARVEQRVAAEQGRTVAMRDDADMRHRMARRVEAFQFDGLADLDDVTGLEAAVNALDLVLGAGMRQQFGVRRADDLIVAAGMVAVMVRVQHLRDAPALCLRGGEAFLVVERIDRERLAGFGAGDQVIEIPSGIGGPDLFDNHPSAPGVFSEARV